MNARDMLLAVVVAAFFHSAASAMLKEEYLDPRRDHEVSVDEDLRRILAPEVDSETGLWHFRRDYLRRNHETSEYTRLWYSSTQNPAAFVNLADYIEDRDGLECNQPEKILRLECYDSSLLERLIPGALLMYSHRCNQNPMNYQGHHVTVFRNITGDYTVSNEQSEYINCLKIDIPTKIVSPLWFVGSTACHYYSNHSATGRRLTDDNPKSALAALLAASSPDSDKTGQDVLLHRGQEASPASQLELQAKANSLRVRRGAALSAEPYLTDSNLGSSTLNEIATIGELLEAASACSKASDNRDAALENWAGFDATEASFKKWMYEGRNDSPSPFRDLIREETVDGDSTYYHKDLVDYEINRIAACMSVQAQDDMVASMTQDLPEDEQTICSDNTLMGACPSAIANIAIDFGLFKLYLGGFLCGLWSGIAPAIDAIIKPIYCWVQEKIKDAINGVKNWINEGFANAGLSPLHDGRWPGGGEDLGFGKEYDIFSFNYNKKTKKAIQDPIVMVETEDTTLHCENCYARATLGIGFEFQSDALDIFHIPPTVPSQLEYMRLWVVGGAEAEASLMLKMTSNTYNFNILLNGDDGEGNKPTNVDHQDKAGDEEINDSAPFHPWEYDVPVIFHTTFSVGPIPVELDFFMSVFAGVDVTITPLEGETGGRGSIGAYAGGEVEAGLVYFMPYKTGENKAWYCRMEGCCYAQDKPFIDTWFTSGDNKENYLKGNWNWKACTQDEVDDKSPGCFVPTTCGLSRVGGSTGPPQLTQRCDRAIELSKEGSTGWCEYLRKDFVFDKWGPDLEMEGIQIDFKLFPVFTLEVWGGVIGAHIQLDNVISVNFDFVDSCNGLRSSSSPALSSANSTGVELVNVNDAPEQRRSHGGGIPAGIKFGLRFRIDVLIWANIHLELVIPGLGIKLFEIKWKVPSKGVYNVSLLPSIKLFETCFQMLKEGSEASEVASIQSTYLDDQCVTVSEMERERMVCICNNENDFERERQDTMVLVNEQAYGIRTVKVCTEGDRDFYQGQAQFRKLSMAGLDIDEQSRFVEGIDSDNGNTVTKDFYVYSSVFEIDRQRSMADGDKLKLWSELWVPEYHPGLVEETCEAGELGVLRQDVSGGDWVRVQADIDCSVWNARKIPSITAELDFAAVNGETDRGQRIRFVLVGTGEARWGRGPCASADNTCDDEASCTMTTSGIACECNAGFTGDGKYCGDINECGGPLDKCGANSTCTNTEGSFDCACQLGYADTHTQDQWTIRGIDAFEVEWKVRDTVVFKLSNPGPFDTEVRMTADSDYNTVAEDRFYWKRPGRMVTFNVKVNNAGFHLMWGNRLMWTFQHRTVWTLGDIMVATSPPGGGNPDILSVKVCTDVNECEGEDHLDCDELATCANTKGSFTCACARGYTPADNQEPTPLDDLTPNQPYGDGTLCYDEDECLFDRDDCSELADCANTFGSFTCTCMRGYTSSTSSRPDGNSNAPMRTGVECYDMDECSFDTHDCAVISACANTNGSFTCSCPRGYTPADNQNPTPLDDGAPNLPYGDGTLCYDEDECLYSRDNCAAIAICYNTIGSFTCTCSRGYTSNVTSDPRNDNADGSMCYDADECKFQTHNCHPEAECRDTDGSFTCSCPRGYTPADNHEPTPDDFTDGLPYGTPLLPFGDGSMCYDEDECWFETHNCDEIASCDNTIGSFLCIVPAGYYAALSLPSGNKSFSGDPFEGGDGSVVADANECFFYTDNCDAIATCANTEGSFTCSCPTGYTAAHSFEPGSPFGDASVCLDANECFFETHNCAEAATCTNTPGSFDCACDHGYYGEGTIGTCATCMEDAAVCHLFADCAAPHHHHDVECLCKLGFSGDGTAYGVPEPVWVEEGSGRGCWVDKGLPVHEALGRPEHTVSTIDVTLALSKRDLCQAMAWLTARKPEEMALVAEAGADRILAHFNSSSYSPGLWQPAPHQSGVQVLSSDLDIANEVCSGRRLADLLSVVDSLGDEASAMSRVTVAAAMSLFNEWKDPDGLQRYDSVKADPGEAVLNSTLARKLYNGTELVGEDAEEFGFFFHLFDASNDGSLDWTEFQAMVLSVLNTDYRQTSRRRVLSSQAGFSSASLDMSLTVIFENENPYLNDITLDAMVKNLASHAGVLKAKSDASSLNVACDAAQYDKCHRHATCRSDTCLCPVGSWGSKNSHGNHGKHGAQDKLHCKLGGGWAVRFQTPLPTDILAMQVHLNCRNESLRRGNTSDEPNDQPSCTEEVLQKWETLVPTLLPLFGETPEWFWSSMHHRIITNETGTRLLQVNGIFQQYADASDSAKHLAMEILGDGVVVGLGITLSTATVNDGEPPAVFKWRLSRHSNDQPFDNVKYIGRCDPERPEPSNLSFVDPQHQAATAQYEDAHGTETNVMATSTGKSSNANQIEVLTERTNSLVIISIASIGVGSVALLLAIIIMMYLTCGKSGSPLPLGPGNAAVVRAGDVEASKSHHSTLVYENQLKVDAPTVGAVMSGSTVVRVEPEAVLGSQ